MNIHKPLVSLLTVALVTTLVMAACGGGGPRQHSFTLRVENGKPEGGVKTFQVKQGDTVSFNIRSDTKGEVHLHGYDLEKEMVPGQTVTLSLTATATGRFKIEIEKVEVELGFLEVQPR